MQHISLPMRAMARALHCVVLGGRWISDIAYDLTPDLLGEYFKLWGAIQSVQLDLGDTKEDVIVWTLESSGEYMTKSAYNIQFEGQIR